jgi:hypothetical protein
MAILSPTAITGTIAALGIVRDRETSPCAEPVEAVDLGFDGIAGESHSGLTRPSCSRVLAQYPERGTEIRNSRQISIVSEEDLAAIAAALGIPDLPSGWLGANVVLRGLPDLTLVPPASRLVFAGGAVLTVDMENAPCTIPAREIERRHPGRGSGFRTAARNRRGLTAWVERPGHLSIGEAVRLHVPPIRPYPPLAGA